MMTAQKREFKADKEASTYRWELRLSGPKAYIFDGYSKSVGMDEKHDKQALFQDCIARILNNGYLDKTYQMLFYKREYMHKSADTLLLEMYPDHFVAHEHLQFDLATIGFLERVYNARATGQRLNYKELLPPRVSKRDQEARDFAFTLHLYPTEDLLVEKCKELLNRYERKRVEAWWRQCRTYYFGRTPTPPSEPMVYRPPVQSVNPIAEEHRKAQEQTVKAAQNSLSSLHNKFKSNR